MLPEGGIVRAEKSGLSSIGFWLSALLCVFLALQPSTSGAAKKKKKPPSVKEQPAPPPLVLSDLSEPPPADAFGARLEWAGTEADRLRTAIAKSPRDERARVLMASLAVVVATDLERALSAGDTDSAAALRRLIEKKLPDTRWRLGWMGRQGAGGGFFALGVIALHGILGQRDSDVACSMFSSAWDKGFLDSAYRLSDCVAGKDPARAADLLRAAAESGHAIAHEQLGRLCLEAKPQDAACAFAQVSAAAAAGRPSAKSLLGWMYAQGVGVAADPQRALTLYLDAAKAGDLSARNNLGELYETGRGVPADGTRAAAYYKEAAEAGFGPAQFNLGRLYAAGTGVTRDADKARTWLNAALKSGVRPAQKILDWLDSQGTSAR
jgi:TPR repeat protein